MPALADLSIHQQVIEIKALKFALVGIDLSSNVIVISNPTAKNNCWSVFPDIQRTFAPLSSWSQLICPARSVPRLGEYDKLSSAELRALN